MSGAESWSVGLSQRAGAILRAKMPAEGPEHPAGNDFANIDYRILVRNSQNMMLSFQPDHMHGTTLPFGVRSFSAAFTLSKHVVAAFQKSSDAACEIRRRHRSSINDVLPIEELEVLSPQVQDEAKPAMRRTRRQQQQADHLPVDDLFDGDLSDPPSESEDACAGRASNKDDDMQSGSGSADLSDEYDDEDYEDDEDDLYTDDDLDSDYVDED